MSVYVCICLYMSVCLYVCSLPTVTASRSRAGCVDAAPALAGGPAHLAAIRPAGRPAGQAAGQLVFSWPTPAGLSGRPARPSGRAAGPPGLSESAALLRDSAALPPLRPPRFVPSFKGRSLILKGNPLSPSCPTSGLGFSPPSVGFSPPSVWTSPSPRGPKKKSCARVRGPSQDRFRNRAVSRPPLPLTQTSYVTITLTRQVSKTNSFQTTLTPNPEQLGRSYP